MIVFNGLFLMKNWDQLVMLWDFVCNFDYYDKEKVKLEMIYFEVFKEINIVYNLYELGELDVVVLIGDFVK